MAGENLNKHLGECTGAKVRNQRRNCAVMAQMDIRMARQAMDILGAIVDDIRVL